MYIVHSGTQIVLQNLLFEVPSHSRQNYSGFVISKFNLHRTTFLAGSIKPRRLPDSNNSSKRLIPYHTSIICHTVMQNLQNIHSSLGSSNKLLMFREHAQSGSGSTVDIIIQTQSLPRKVTPLQSSAEDPTRSIFCSQSRLSSSEVELPLVCKSWRGKVSFSLQVPNIIISITDC